MDKDFDLKYLILTIKNLEWQVKKLKQKVNARNDPIFKEENPEDIITIQKGRYWTNVKKGMKKINKVKILSRENNQIKPD